MERILSRDWHLSISARARARMFMSSPHGALTDPVTRYNAAQVKERQGNAFF